MDSSDVERERGIMILARNTAIGATDPSSQNELRVGTSP